MPGKYDHIDFKPPKSVANEALRGLELHHEYKRGGTAIDLRRAIQLSKRRTISPSVAKKLYKTFLRHVKNKDDITRAGEPSNNKILWSLIGGDSGRAWARSLWRQMESANSKAQGQVEDFESNFVIKGYQPSSSSAYYWNMYAPPGVNPPGLVEGTVAQYNFSDKEEQIDALVAMMVDAVCRDANTLQDPEFSKVCYESALSADLPKNVKFHWIDADQTSPGEVLSLVLGENLDAPYIEHAHLNGLAADKAHEKLLAGLDKTDIERAIAMANESLAEENAKIGSISPHRIAYQLLKPKLSFYKD